MDANIDIALALDRIRPGAAWRMADTYENLATTWEDETQTLPTEQEIADAWGTIQRDQALDALDEKYAKIFDTLTLAWAVAAMDDNDTIAAARKADKEAAKLQYLAEMEAILNG